MSDRVYTRATYTAKGREAKVQSEMKGTLLTFSTLLAISIALPMETEVQPDAENGKLNVITITQEEIEGECRSSTGGIHFRSIVRAL